MQAVCMMTVDIIPKDGHSEAFTMGTVYTQLVCTTCDRVKFKNGMPILFSDDFK